jgi:intracellular septation protein A
MSYEGHEEDKAKILNTLGGARGIVDTGTPSILFLITYDVTKSLDHSAIAALALSVVLTIVRLVRRETLQHALSGIFIVAICALIAHHTGKAKDFYLPGLIINALYAALYLITNLTGWPVLGLILGPILGENVAWRKNSARKSAYVRAGWVWFGLFVSRLLIQYPLYKANKLNWLGTALVVMGYPLFFATGWITWLILRKVPTVKVPESVTE